MREPLRNAGCAIPDHSGVAELIREHPGTISLGQGRELWSPQAGH